MIYSLCKKGEGKPQKPERKLKWKITKIILAVALDSADF
jgi:hypothetical protein